VSNEEYQPLAELVHDRIAASERRPFLVAVTGGVAAGKSTVAEALRTLLGAGPERFSVEVVPADGFLFPNAELDRRGLAARKGAPETYDLDRIARFLAEVRAGAAEVRAPVYSHLTYDVVAGEERMVRPRGTLIMEGTPLLQDEIVGFFDLSIYVDAVERDLERWYVERFLSLRESARHDRESFYAPFLSRSEDETAAIAHEVWRTVNGPNVRDHVLPTRDRADIVVEKGADHSLGPIRLRAR